MPKAYSTAMRIFTEKLPTLTADTAASLAVELSDTAEELKLSRDKVVRQFFRLNPAEGTAFVNARIAAHAKSIGFDNSEELACQL